MCSPAFSSLALAPCCFLATRRSVLWPHPSTMMSLLCYQLTVVQTSETWCRIKPLLLKLQVSDVFSTKKANRYTYCVGITFRWTPHAGFAACNTLGFLLCPGCCSAAHYWGCWPVLGLPCGWRVEFSFVLCLCFLVSLFFQCYCLLCWLVLLSLHLISSGIFSSRDYFLNSLLISSLSHWLFDTPSFIHIYELSWFPSLIYRFISLWLENILVWFQSS